MICSYGQGYRGQHINQRELKCVEACRKKRKHEKGSSIGFSGYLFFCFFLGNHVSELMQCIQVLQMSFYNLMWFIAWIVIYQDGALVNENRASVGPAEPEAKTETRNSKSNKVRCDCDVLDC